MDYISERGIINAFVLGQNLGLSEAAIGKRIVKVIEEGFMIKELNKKLAQEIKRTEKFFFEFVKDLNKEKNDFAKYGLKNL